MPMYIPGEGHSNPLQYSCLENSMTEKPGGLQSMGLQRVGHDLATKEKQQQTTIYEHLLYALH